MSHSDHGEFKPDAAHGAQGGGSPGQDGAEGHGATRRDFIFIATGAVGGVGVVSVAWPFIDQMNPAADTRALSSIEVDLSSMEEGQQIKTMWQGKPLFIRRRTQAEIQSARAVGLGELKDPQTDEARTVQADGEPGKPEFLIMEASCTHLGCIPLGEDGDYGGWFCPCHGSHYDTSGRIRKGPAPKNLPIPPYVFVSDSVVKIG